MLATEERAFARDGSGAVLTCRLCGNRKVEGRDEHGRQYSRCQVTGLIVKFTTRIDCGSRTISESLRAYNRDWKDKHRPGYNAYHREYQQKVRDAGVERKLTKLDAEPEKRGRSAPAVIRLLSRCPRCGSGMLYRDEDGQGCQSCGFHSWVSASEPLAMLRPFGDLPYYHIDSKRRWNV